MVGEVWRNCNQILGASNALPFKLRVCNSTCAPDIPPIAWFSRKCRFFQSQTRFHVSLPRRAMENNHETDCQKQRRTTEWKLHGGRSRYDVGSMRGDQEGAIGCHFIGENIGPTTVHSQGPFLEIRGNSVVSCAPVSGPAGI